MRGANHLLLFLGAITGFGQAYVTASDEVADVQLGILGAGSDGVIEAVGRSNKRQLQSSTVRSFDIVVTFINSINLIEDTAVDITFDGSSGPVGTFTVTAPAPGGTEFFEFCLNAAGESEISSGSDMDDTVLIINFTAGQTIAFRDTARSVFEAAIVRGELDFNEAYKVFTDWMLSLSRATAPQETAQQHPTPWSTAGGIRPSQEGASTGVDDGKTPPSSSAASATKRTLDSSDKVAKQEALTEMSNKKPERWFRGIDADAPNAGAEPTADPRERKDGNRAEESPLFSVREISQHH